MTHLRALGFSLLALVNLQLVQAQDEAATITSLAPAAEPSTDSNGDQIESLLNLASDLLTSIFPSSTITDIASLSWPETVVIDSSTYSVSSSLSTLITSTTTSSTSEPTVAPMAGSEDSSDDSSDDGGVPLGMILGIVFGVLALLLILLAACLLRRRRSRKRRAGAESPSDTGSEVLSSSHSTKEWPEKYTNRPAPPPPRTASPQFNRYSADDETLLNSTNRTVPMATIVHPAHRTGGIQTQDFASPYYAPHLHTPPSTASPPTVAQPAYLSGAVNRDSGYYSHPTESQIPQPPSIYSARYQGYQGVQNPFTSPAYSVPSPSPSPINRRPVPKDSTSSLTRSSGNRLSSPLVSEDSSNSNDSYHTPAAELPGTPYIPPRSPKRRSAGSDTHYPPPAEASHFNFGFEPSHSRFSFEGSNATSSPGQFRDVPLR